MRNKNRKIRNAKISDLERLIELLENDPLGHAREKRESLAPYQLAFNEIEKSRDHEIFVVDEGEKVIATLQVSWIPNLTFQGGRRALIEGVRVDKAYQGKGIGTSLIQHIIEKARDKQCVMVQLTSNLKRSEAVNFYEKMGFQSTHVGLKLML